MTGDARLQALAQPYLLRCRSSGCAATSDNPFFGRVLAATRHVHRPGRPARACRCLARNRCGRLHVERQLQLRGGDSGAARTCASGCRWPRVAAAPTRARVDGAGAGAVASVGVRARVTNQMLLLD